MKKRWMLSVAAVLALVGCGQNEEKETNKEAEKEETTLKVASLISPMTDILELVEPKLEEQGIDLEIVVLGDNVQPNSALAAKEVDANFFRRRAVYGGIQSEQ